MSDSNHPRNPADAARAEALEWLAGQFRWESLLIDLHELAAREAAPVVQLDHGQHRTSDHAPQPESENARRVS